MKLPSHKVLPTLGTTAEDVIDIEILYTTEVSSLKIIQIKKKYKGGKILWQWINGNQKNQCYPWTKTLLDIRSISF